MDVISVIGLGKLGAPMVAVFASKGFKVVGLDINQEFVNKLAQGIAPVNEPQLKDFLAKYKTNISTTLDYKEIVERTDVTFIIVPTPSDKHGVFSNDYVLAVIKELGAALKHKNTKHNVVVTSTVMPGSTDGIIKSTLEKASGKKVGQDIGLCYNPEFIALGTVIRDMLYPDMVLIGESDVESGNQLERIYNKVHGDHQPSIQRMNFVNAELTKISVNTFVTTKISYANMMSDMCDHLDGADVDVVCGALGSDSRIGKKYLKGGLGYGGPCFPRDNIAFAKLADQIGADATLAKATDHINKLQPKRVVKKVQKLQGKNVTVLGLSYKPETEVSEESQGVMIANELVTLGYNVNVYDPEAMVTAKNSLVEKVKCSSSLEDSLQDSEIIVIATPWKEFDSYFKENNVSANVVDCWKIIKKQGGII
ncbi:MAG: UDP-glucose/GDP-mannose dehydrogenase family protein [Rickettsiales bacterium]|nr:UDP-glucose/GDP-mannose dehydrogenase family protein [Rickettsiales bacterium]